MTGSQSKVYRVTGQYKSGRIVSHLVGAVDAYRAGQNVATVDNRIAKITSILPVTLSDFSQQEFRSL
jgi:hypothetical protein